MFKAIIERWQKFDSAASAAGWAWWAFSLATGVSAGTLMGYLTTRLQWFWDQFGWAGALGVGILTWAFIGFGLNHYAAWSARRRPSTTNSTPAVARQHSEGAAPTFGSPAQRVKSKHETYWHVPIKVADGGPYPECKAYLDLYSGDECVDRIRLCWGDRTFEEPRDFENLVAGRVSLIPVAWRSEEGADRKGYFADARFVRDHSDRQYPIASNRVKRRFKLRITSGNLIFESPHFYLVRCPEIVSNGHFVVEVEYEGEGSRDRGMHSFDEPAAEPAPQQVTRQPTPYEIERKLRALDETVVPHLDRMRLLINEGEGLQSSGWSAFKNPNSYPEYREKIKDFRDRFRIGGRELTAIIEELEAHSDIGDALASPSHETWARAIEKYMVKYDYFHTWMHKDASSEAYAAFMEDDANAFGKAIIEYSHWCGVARARVVALQRKLAA
jgi:hypothetical protein